MDGARSQSPLLDALATQAVRRDAVATVHRLRRALAESGAAAAAEPYIVLASLSCSADAYVPRSAMANQGGLRPLTIR